MSFWKNLWDSPLSWIVPGKGVYDIYKGLSGGEKPEAPDLSFYQNWGQYPTEAVEKGEKAIMGQQTQWLKDAMRGIQSTGYQRGLGQSSYIPEMGERAAGEAVSRYAPALAQLHQWGAGQQQMGDIRGKEAYTQIMMNYMTQMGGQDNDNWIAQLMGLLPSFL